MVDPELGLALVFNGAIYNYRELRRDLLAKGHRFFSEGDTEVILKAYAEWGERCVEHLPRHVRLRRLEPARAHALSWPATAWASSRCTTATPRAPSVSPPTVKPCWKRRTLDTANRPGRPAPSIDPARGHPRAAHDPAKASASWRPPTTPQHRPPAAGKRTGVYWRLARRDDRKTPRAEREWIDAVHDALRLGRCGGCGMWPTCRSACCCPAGWIPESTGRRCWPKSGVRDLRRPFRSASRISRKRKAASSNTPTRLSPATRPAITNI